MRSLDCTHTHIHSFSLFHTLAPFRSHTQGLDDPELAVKSERFDLSRMGLDGVEQASGDFHLDHDESA